MKTTAQRLSEVYCKPKSHEDWDAIYPKATWMGQYPSSHSHVCYEDTGKYLASYPNENASRTEIPVQHFIDLIEDKIVVWRLLEDGFVKGELDFREDYYLEDEEGLAVISVRIDAHKGVTIYQGSKNSVTLYGVKTYTDLLTLIRILK